jgi:hypothetical protein
MSSIRPTVEKENAARRKAVVLRAKDERSNRGTLLMHVDEQDGRLVPGGLILAVPVYPGQAGLDAALFGMTMGFTCTQTIHRGQSCSACRRCCSRKWGLHYGNSSGISRG